MLASAVAGRPVSIAYLMGKDQRGFSDGDCIHLPVAASVKHQRQQVLVQAALIAGGSFQVRLLGSLVGHAELRQRYLLLEVERCCGVFQARLPNGFLSQVRQFSSGLKSATPERSLQLAKSNRRLPVPPPWFGTLVPWRVVRASLGGNALKTDAATLARLEARLKKVEADEDKSEEDSIERTSFWRWLSSPLAKETFLSRLIRELFDMQSSPGGDSSSGTGGASEIVSGRRMRRMRALSNAIRSSSGLDIPSAFVVEEVGAHSYPEWDVGRGRYRSNWVSVEELDPHSTEPQFEAGAMSTAGLRQFQQSVARLCLGFQRHRNLMQGDDLVLDRLVKLATDIRTGHSPDERIFSASLRTRRDLGVEILLDVSSSTLERAANGRRVFDLQAEAAWKLCRAFALLGDRVAMHGFHSWGRTLVRFQRLKDFDDPTGASLEQRMRMLSVAGYTRCGAAIRHATTLLCRRAGTPHKLLLVISDGYPFDDQYEGAYASADTRKALEEARRNGVACLCLSVGSDANRARLEEVYGQANYMSVEKVDQIPWRLGMLAESAIANAAKVRERANLGA